MTSQPDMLPILAASATPAVQRVGEYFISPSTRSLVAQATLCAIERDAMLTPDLMVTRTLSVDMRAHLEYEAERRGADIETVYQEEIAAKAELAKITPRNADLLRIAERFPAPQAWYDE